MFVSGWEEDEQGVEPGDPNQESNQFLTAAENGDLELVKEMITRNPDLLHVRDRDFYTPLHRAAYSDKLETVEYLLSLGESLAFCLLFRNHENHLEEGIRRKRDFIRNYF